MPHECWFPDKTEQVRPGVWWLSAERSSPFAWLFTAQCGQGVGRVWETLWVTRQGYPSGHPHVPKGCPPLTTLRPSTESDLLCLWGGGPGEGF